MLLRSISAFIIASTYHVTNWWFTPSNISDYLSFHCLHQS